MRLKVKKVTEEKHECPPHHFIINSDNVGQCKYCPEIRDFGRLLQRAGVFGGDLPALCNHPWGANYLPSNGQEGLPARAWGGIGRWLRKRRENVRLTTL